MSDTKISALSAVTDVLDTDEFVLARAGTTKKIDASDLAVVLAGGEAWTVVRKTIDESVASSIVVQNDDDLFFTAVSGSTYEVEVFLVYGSPAGNTTPDLKFNFGEDGTTRGSGILLAYSTTDTSATSVLASSTAAVGTAGTTTLNRSLTWKGWILGNGGTWRLQWAQNTSGVNATIVRAGSFVRYRVISS